MRLACAAVFLLCPTLAAADGMFECESLGDGAWRIFLTASEPETARAIYALGLDAGGGQSTAYVLDAQPTGSGFRYVGEGLEFVGKGDEARLIDGPEEMFCALAPEGAAEVFAELGTLNPGAGAEDGGDDGAMVTEAAAADPDTSGTDTSGTAITPALPAMALGGNVRAAPRVDAAKVGSLPRGAFVLLEETGPDWDGYTWFRLRHPGGVEGHVWGGILCAPTGGVAGVLDTCP